MRYRTKLMAGASLAVVGVVAAASMAVALWNADGVFTGGSVRAGDLQVTTSEGSWKQVTPGVASPLSGTLSSGTEGFHTMPGDVVEISVPITTTLQGENLNAELGVDLGAGASGDIKAGVVAASYRVEDSTGAQVAPAAGEAQVGDSLQLPGLESSNDGISANWTVVVTIEVLGDYRWTAEEPLLDLASWSLDGINVELQQMREGKGFVTTGGDAS